MYAIYAYIGVVWGVNVGMHGSPMECLGMSSSNPHGDRADRVPCLAPGGSKWFGEFGSMDGEE